MRTNIKKPLEWSRPALEQIEAQFEYAISHLPISPETLQQRLQKAVVILESHPGIGTVGRVAGTREWMIKGTPLTLIYRVKPRKIQILAVVHQRAFYVANKQ